MEDIRNSKHREKEKYFCTIFTSTYNRAYILQQLYDSLCRQTYDDFEWIIIDDGSTDNTFYLINKWLNANKIAIRYLKKINGGKHRAINLGTDIAFGEFFFIVDSDDYLVDNALEIIKHYSLQINSIEYAGVSGLKIFSTGEPIGNYLANEYIDATNLERKKYNLLGDKAEVYYTKILKRNKFPEIENENFIHESIVYNKIASEGYKIRWFNKPLVICEYISDGLTKNADIINRKNPKGYLLALESDLSTFNPSTFMKIYYYYARYYKFAKIIYKKPIRYTLMKCNTNIFSLMLSLIINFIREIKNFIRNSFGKMSKN